MLEEKETHIGDIVNSLTSVLSSLYVSQRVTVAAFFAEVSNMDDNSYCPFNLGLGIFLVFFYLKFQKRAFTGCLGYMSNPSL